MTNLTPQSLFKNDILANLPPEETRILRPLLTRVQLVRDQSIYDSGAPIERVYFVETGLLAMRAPFHPGQSKVVIDVFGRQSASGLTALLYPEASSYHETIVQLPGFARRINAGVLRQSISRLPIFKKTLLQALDFSLVRVSQNTLCQAKHTLQQRLARWLLTLSEQEPSDTLDVTQNTLATALAVKRPRVANAIASLEAAALIRHSRGRLSVSDADSLQSVACDCNSRLEAYRTRLRQYDTETSIDRSSSTRLHINT